MNIGGISNGFCFIKQKDFVLEKGHWVKHQCRVFTFGICMCEGVGRTWEMGMMSHISFIACRISGIMSRPESRSNLIGGSESSSGCETIYWDLFFFF